MHSALKTEQSQGNFTIEEYRVPLDNGANSCNMRYLKAGAGPALLLVHGLLGYSFSWRFCIPALARHATVYAIDLLGTGFSDRPAKLDCSFKASAQRLLQFMDKTGLASCDLLGTSHGGAVSMFAASLAPDRIRKLILVDPVNPWSAHGKRLTAFLSNPLIAPLFSTLTPHVEACMSFTIGACSAIRSAFRRTASKATASPCVCRVLTTMHYRWSVPGIATWKNWNRRCRALRTFQRYSSGAQRTRRWIPASAAQLKRIFPRLPAGDVRGSWTSPVRRSAGRIQSRGDRIPGTRVSLMHSLAGANLEARTRR